MCFFYLIFFSSSLLLLPPLLLSLVSFPFHWKPLLTSSVSLQSSSKAICYFCFRYCAEGQGYCSREILCNQGKIASLMATLRLFALRSGCMTSCRRYAACVALCVAYRRCNTFCCAVDFFLFSLCCFLLLFSFHLSASLTVLSRSLSISLPIYLLINPLQRLYLYLNIGIPFDTIRLSSSKANRIDLQYSFQQNTVK